MYMSSRILILAGVVCLLCARFCAAADNTEPNLTKDQIKDFLLTAKVIKSKQISKGITHPWRLTLSDGTLSHEAHFQAIDEHKSVMQMASGRMEMNFVDSYKYNIAAFVLAEMLGLDNMVPVSVERKWQGDTGSMTWWLTVKMDDAERHKRKIEPPDPDAWNKQMYRVRVFDQLIYDTDANLGNVLIGEDWHVWRVDFTRAFRTYKTLQRPDDLQHCDRQLLQRLKALDQAQFAAATKRYLTKTEVDAVMARRDKIVKHFQELIAEKGEGQILY